MSAHAYYEVVEHVVLHYIAEHMNHRAQALVLPVEVDLCDAPVFPSRRGVRGGNPTHEMTGQRTS
jgi:hypothetical protein